MSRHIPRGGGRGGGRWRGPVSWPWLARPIPTHESAPGLVGSGRWGGGAASAGEVDQALAPAALALEVVAVADQGPTVATWPIPARPRATEKPATPTAKPSVARWPATLAACPATSHGTRLARTSGRPMARHRATPAITAAPVSATAAASISASAASAPTTTSTAIARWVWPSARRAARISTLHPSTPDASLAGLRRRLPNKATLGGIRPRRGRASARAGAPPWVRSRSSRPGCGSKL